MLDANLSIFCLELDLSGWYFLKDGTKCLKIHNEPNYAFQYLEHFKTKLCKTISCKMSQKGQA